MAFGDSVLNLFKKVFGGDSTPKKAVTPTKSPAQSKTPAQPQKQPEQPRPKTPPKPVYKPTAAMYSRDAQQNMPKRTAPTEPKPLQWPGQVAGYFDKLMRERDQNSDALLTDRDKDRRAGYYASLENDGTIARADKFKESAKKEEATWDKDISTSGPITASHVDEDTGETRFKIDKEKWNEDKYPGGVATPLGPGTSGEMGYYLLKGAEEVRDVNDKFGRSRQTMAMYANATDEQREEMWKEGPGNGLEAEMQFIAPDGTKFTKDEAIITYTLKDGTVVERKRMERAFADENLKVKVDNKNYVSIAELEAANVVDGKYLMMKNQNGEYVKARLDDITSKVANKEYYGTYAPDVYIDKRVTYNTDEEWDKVSETRTPDGTTVIRRGDGKVPETDMGTIGYEQSEGRGPLGLGVYDPRAPWMDKAGNAIGTENYNPKQSAIDEIVPWMIDATLQSAPYIINPTYGWISALSEALPYTYGIDASDYDSETETYGGGRLTPAKQLGSAVSPVVDMFAEKLPFEFIGDKLVGSKNFLGKGLPSAVLSSAVTEAFEETASPLAGNLSQDGYKYWSVPKKYSEVTGEWEYDTSQMSEKARIKKLLGDMLQQGAAGGMVGGEIELARGLNSRRKAYSEYKRLMNEAGVNMSAPDIDTTMYEPSVMKSGARNYSEE